MLQGPLDSNGELGPSIFTRVSLKALMATTAMNFRKQRKKAAVMKNF